jgi:hypothetical protein
VTTEIYYPDMESKADSSWVKEQFDSMIAQTAKDITFQFEQSKQYTIDATSPLNAFKEQVQAYQRFSADGLELGAINSPFLARLGNTKLSF